MPADAAYHVSEPATNMKLPINTRKPQFIKANDSEAMDPATYHFQQFRQAQEDPRCNSSRSLPGC